eukprot:scaffold1708_cov322-Pavlova_lutheri.AAC.15
MASSHARWNEPDLREGYGSHNRANGYDPERTSPDEFTVGIEGPPPRPKAGGEYSLLGAHRRCGNARGDVAGACDVDEGGGLGQEIRMDVRARCEETEGSSRADDVGVGGRLTTQETCRYDTWTSPEKAALMGGRGRTKSEIESSKRCRMLTGSSGRPKVCTPDDLAGHLPHAGRPTPAIHDALA